jgi:hypothetical protein
MIRMARRTSILPRLGLILLALLAFGAGPPEVVRIRVPSDQVSRWFPPGTELRGLAAAEFDVLVQAAQAGSRD